MSNSREFGIVTMAESAAAIARACGLASSLDATGEHIPRALLYSRELSVPAGFFDLVIPMPDDPYRERWFYLNKLVHPFALTPFGRTLFLDSDVLVRRPLSGLVTTHFLGKPVALCVKHESVEKTGSEGNHFIPKRFVEAFGTTMVQNPDGGGHMYFESGPDSASVVARALRLVTSQEALYHRLSGDYGFISDELALLAILTIDGIVLPANVGAVHPVQHDEVGEILALMRGQAPDGVHDEVAIFHFFGKAKESEAYRRILSSIPTRWPV